jgi:PhoPQ-activated pathogenicity-related protein
MHIKQRLAMVAVACAALLATTPLALATALDDYVNEFTKENDPFFGYSVAKTITGTGYTAKVLNMASQQWRSPSEVDQTIWQHWVSVIRPTTVTKNTALLYITGTDNDDPMPTSVDSGLRDLAIATGSVVVELRMVPNQPLVFSDEGFEREEDAIIAYSWNKYLESHATTVDNKWPVQLAMVKSAVRAMDATIDFSATTEGGSVTINDFVVSGGSKRGWTTWLTAAVDDRVKAINPYVIDLLNIDESFIHHWESYGFWSPAIDDYVEAGITEWGGTPELRALYDIVDPFVYKDRLTMPKFMVNSAGDDFFLPDSSQFYFHELEGPKYQRYVPNTNHGLGGSDASQSGAAFYNAQLNGATLPEFTWEVEDGILHVETQLGTPTAKIWYATNDEARDFRLSTLGPGGYQSQNLVDLGGGTFEWALDPPDDGWTAYFIELTFPSGWLYPYKFTTDVFVAGPDGPFLGDLNNDGEVDIFDIGFLSDRWMTAGPYGDANHDGIVDIFDVGLLSDHWTGAGAGVSVPEPSSLSLTASSLAMLAGLALAMRALRAPLRVPVPARVR